MRIQEIEHDLRNLLLVVHGLAVNLSYELTGLLAPAQKVVFDTIG